MNVRMCWTVLLLAGMGAGQSALAMAGAGGGARASRGYLGVDVHDVGDDQVAALKLKEARGAEVVRVDHDGPAGTAGIHEHDVVLSMNGQAIEGEEQMRRMLHETPSGRTLTLVISRDGQTMTLTALMGNREEVERMAWQRHLLNLEPGPPPAPPAVADGPAPADAGAGGRGDGAGRGGALGFFHSSGTAGMPTVRSAEHNLLAGASGTGAMLEALSPQLAEFFGAPNGAGLLVRSVSENSPAAEGGMKAGDVVVRVNQAAVASCSDWTKMARESKGRPVSVVVVREKREQTLTITPDGKHRSRLELPASVGLEGFVGIGRAPAELAETCAWVDRRLRGGGERRVEARPCGGEAVGAGSVEAAGLI